jgi:surface antigen
MTMKHFIAAIIIPATLMSGLTACDNQQIGTIAGSAGGAAAGRAIGGDGTGGYVGLILGAIAGGYLGGKVGEWLTNKDKQQMSTTTNQALEQGKAGQTYSWTNPDSGNKGSVTPTQSFRNQDGSTCRDFSSNVSSAQGQTANGAGVACKQADGTWQIVKSS